ncbi:hypothetical protein Tco_0777808 [Tanacetum coccineum]
MNLWSMRMEQYLTHTDYVLWEVIVNGDAPAVASASVEGLIPPKTAEILKEDKKVKRFLKKTRRNLNFNSKKTIGFDKTKVEYGIGGYDWSYQAKEGPTDFALMTHLSLGSSNSSSSNTEVRDNSITELKNQLAEALREKDDLKLKLEKFETSSMKLTKLINSQISVNNKSGVGFDSQMNENELHECHLNKSKVFERHMILCERDEEENNQVNDSLKKVRISSVSRLPILGNTCPQS